MAETPRPAESWNLPLPTLGGRQLWGDVQFFHGWRIQQNVLDGHYRLLDEDDVRHASGTLDDCRARLDAIRQQRQLPPMRGRAVILVHGIIRSSKSFRAMKSALEQSGFSVFGFDYPSTRVDIGQSAGYLRSCVNSLQGIDEIHLVAHSMGGLVVRAMLREGTDVRIRRMVMLGVPNHGARLASLLQENVIYRTVYGPAGQQLAEDPRGLIAELPVPGFEFAVIAGARGAAKPSSAAPPSGGDVEPTSERERPKIPAPAPGSGNTTTTSFADGFNPLIPGDDDGTVSVESTKLPGAADFLTVRVWHSFLMSDLTVIEATVRFLQSGALRATGLKHPLPREPMATPRPDDRAPAT